MEKLEKITDYNYVIDVIKKSKPFYPSCFLSEYQYYKESQKKITYHDVQSDKQIQTILQISKTKAGMKNYHRLTNILAKSVKLQDYLYFLNKLLSKKTITDTAVYNVLSNFTRQSGGENKCDRNTIRAELFYYIISKHLIEQNKSFLINNYLDIGCGDCKLTKILGKKFGLNLKNIFGLDIKEWFDYKSNRNANIQLTLINEGEKLPYKDEEFSITSAFMVLHHTKNLDQTLKEINRITKKNGYFIIREHDCLTKADYMLTDIEHAIYERVYKKNPEDHKKFMETYYAKYYDKLEWEVILKEYGFEYIYVDYDPLTIYYDLLPTRSFLGIFRKV